MFLSILFIPMMFSFIQLISCKNFDSQNKNSTAGQDNNSYSSCWNSIYIVHGFVALIAASLLLFFSIIFSGLYFDGIYSEERLISKRTSHDKMTQMIFQFFIIIVFIFFQDSDYSLVLVAFFFIASISHFFMTHIKAPFNNPYIQKLQSSCATVQMWVALMLFLAISSEGKVFNGVIYACLLGLPISLGIVIWQPEKSS